MKSHYFHFKTFLTNYEFLFFFFSFFLEIRSKLNGTIIPTFAQHLLDQVKLNFTREPRLHIFRFIATVYSISKCLKAYPSFDPY